MGGPNGINQNSNTFKAAGGKVSHDPPQQSNSGQTGASPQTNNQVSCKSIPDPKVANAKQDTKNKETKALNDAVSVGIGMNHGKDLRGAPKDKSEEQGQHIAITAQNKLDKINSSCLDTFSETPPTWATSGQTAVNYLNQSDSSSNRLQQLLSERLTEPAKANPPAEPSRQPPYVQHPQDR